MARNKLIWGDNKYVLASLIEGDPSIGLEPLAGKVDLIYIDPPFATGADFSMDIQMGDVEFEKEASSIEEVAYRDTWSGGISTYLQMIFDRLVLMKDLLSNNGLIYVHCDYRLSGHINLLLTELFDEKGQLNEIIWRYRRWPTNTRSFQRMHDTLFRYTKGSEKAVFWEQLYEPRAESTQKAFGNRKITTSHTDSGSARLRTGDEISLGTYMSDVWEVSYVQGSASEERSAGNYYPTQKPEALLERVVKSSCPPGGVVLDCFIGSGTTAAVAEKLGFRWIGCDLGRFAIHTTRKRLLGIENCRPFEVLNLGRYERRYWQGINAGEAVYEYFQFIVELYHAEPIVGFTHLHGRKGEAMVHVGATDAPVTIREVRAAMDECKANGLKALDVLGWEWEMGLNSTGLLELQQQSGVAARLFHIPHEIMDKRAIAAGDVHFYEAAYVAAKTVVEPGRAVRVELTDFLVAIDDYIREKVGDKVKKWSDWIDYWAVDFEYNGDVFHNQWQAYRTRKEPKLDLTSGAHTYASAGKRQILVKVVDIFGNDTTALLEVEA